MTQKNPMNALLTSLGLCPRPFRAKRSDGKHQAEKHQQVDRRKTIEKGNDAPRLSTSCKDESPANATLKSVLAKTPTGNFSPAPGKTKSSSSRSERRERKYDDGSISLSDLAFSMEWDEETVRFEGWTSAIEQE